MSKRNDALSAISARPVIVQPPEPAPIPTAQPQATEIAPEKVVRLTKPKAKAVDKVMLYLPPKVARKFKEMAFHEECKAHDLYVQALASFLREKGHSAVADLLKR